MDESSSCTCDSNTLCLELLERRNRGVDQSPQLIGLALAGELLMARVLGDAPRDWRE